MSDKPRIALFMCAFFPVLYVGAAENVLTNNAKVAAEQGDAAAQFRYAEMLRDGSGVKKNVLESVTWTRKAADAGHAGAQCQMGLFYMNGLGVDRDEDKAIEWLKKAAAQNHAQAQYNLGIYYAKFSDKTACQQALKWFKEAIKQDYADTEYNLAKLYLNPQHPASREPDAVRCAISLLRRAAAQGHVGANKMLEELGIAVPQSSSTIDEHRQIKNVPSSTTRINKQQGNQSMKKDDVLKPRRFSAKGVLLGFIAGVSLCVFLGPCSGCKTLENFWKKISEQRPPQPPPQPPRIVPCKEIVDDLRVLWSYERNYAYRHKKLAPSIGKMGDGTGIGKDGFVLASSLWGARIDDNTNAVPISYRVEDAKTGRKVSVGAYRFGIVPTLTSAGEIDQFSVILIAVPDVPANDDFCFVAICGPINLQNDFSFDKEWPVFQLTAQEEVVRKVRGLKPISIDGLKQRLTSGDLKRYVIMTFRNLYYPKDVK